MRRRPPRQNCSSCRGTGYVSVRKDDYSQAKPCHCTAPPKTNWEKQRENQIGKRVLAEILSSIPE